MKSVKRKAAPYGAAKFLYYDQPKVLKTVT